MKNTNVIGKRFYYLTILSLTKHKRYDYAVCKCDCGNIKEICLSNILSKKQKSCGCLAKYNLKHGLTHLQHGLSKHPLHNIWTKIKSRCYNQKDLSYKNYGGRGITMCEEWRTSFKCFYDWAKKNGYKYMLSIDRIDNNKGYYPENCRWATAKEQANNRRSNFLITYNNKTQNLLKWSEEKNIPYTTLRARIKVYRWDIKKALETPVMSTNTPNIRS